MATRSEFRFKDVGAFIREQRKAAELSLRKLAEQAGVSNPYLSQIERGLRKPSAEILQAIAKALRISAETLYLKAGILEERENAGEVIEAILRDASISDRQKQALIEIYESFREGVSRTYTQTEEAPLDHIRSGASVHDETHDEEGMAITEEKSTAVAGM